MQANRTATTLLVAIISVLAFATTANAKWTQVPYPVLKPTLAWETTAVSEPTVIWDKDRYRLWYTGGWATCYLGYAESLDGVHWAKWNRPVLDHACHSNVARINGRFVVYSVPEDGASLQITSSRDGIHMGPTRTVMRLRSNSWDNEFLANTFVWKTGTRWNLMYEARYTSWQTAVVSGNPHSWWPHAPRPMSLGLGTKGMAGGPWRDGNCLYFHASPTGLLPTDIYRRCGPMNKLGPIQRVLQRKYPWEVDQVADPTIARRPGHRPLMLFDAMDNPNHRGLIGAAFETA